MSGRYGSFSDNSEDEPSYDSRSSQSRGGSSYSRNRRNIRDKHMMQSRYNEDHSDLHINSSTEESDSEHDDDFDTTPQSHHTSRYGNRIHASSGGSGGKLTTGRERRKKVARGNKGGEFYGKRRKRRVYFCTLAGEIDVSELKEHLLANNCAWNTKQVGDALILTKQSSGNNYYIPRRSTAASSGNIELMLSERERSYISNKKTRRRRGSSNDRDRDSRRHPRDSHHSRHIDSSQERFQDVSDPRHKEVVVFEFGAVVLWGFSVGEESVLLQTIKDFAAEGQNLVASEFTASEDDMAFLSHSLQISTGNGHGTPCTTHDDGDEEANQDNLDIEDPSQKRIKASNTLEENVDVNSISIANDVISFPEQTTREHRLAVSYAIAQSSIVAIFEERIIRKVAEYKFIPETLASVGKIELSSKQMGMMVGEIFVIRHDLNLHSDILDTPDFFWGQQDRYVDDYERVTRYLETDSRVEVLNTRLNMLKDLLDVLNQQMENDHSTKLEWIIIWLIVIEVVIQLTSVGATILADLSRNS